VPFIHTVVTRGGFYWHFDDRRALLRRCSTRGSGRAPIGNHFMAADHGARSRADVLALAVKRLLA